MPKNSSRRPTPRFMSFGRFSKWRVFAVSHPDRGDVLRILDAFAVARNEKEIDEND